jgi:hypothetical protein
MRLILNLLKPNTTKHVELLNISDCEILFYCRKQDFFCRKTSGNVVGMFYTTQDTNNNTRQNMQIGCLIYI